MARTDASKVQEVISVKPGAQLTRSITWANLITTRLVTCATSKGYSHTAEELVEIETNLAAHHYSIRNAQYISKSTNGASGSFDIKQWYTAALELDGAAAIAEGKTSCLTSMLGKDGKGPNTAGGFWLGRAPSAQTDYVDRD